ncbi:hypothetical protein, partial [Thiolapillus sp.]
TCAIVAKRQSKRLTGNEYKNLQKRYRNILTRGAKQLPPIPLRQNGKRAGSPNPMRTTCGND